MSTPYDRIRQVVGDAERELSRLSVGIVSSHHVTIMPTSKGREWVATCSRNDFRSHPGTAATVKARGQHHLNMVRDTILKEGPK